MLMIRNLLATAILVLGGSSAGVAQGIEDFLLRQELGVSWKPVKRTEVHVGYRLSLEDNASRFHRSMLSAGGNYDLFKWWRIGGEYRYYTSSRKDLHRIQVFTRWDYKVGKFNVLYRLQYQQTQDNFDGDYLQYHSPDRVVRNRLQLRYDLTKKVELYSFAESFTERKKGENIFYRMRYAAGANYLYKRRHSFNLELFVNDEFDFKGADDRVVAVVGYTFHVEKKKKKGSKKKETPSSEQGQD